MPGVLNSIKITDTSRFKWIFFFFKMLYVTSKGFFFGVWSLTPKIHSRGPPTKRTFPYISAQAPDPRVRKPRRGITTINTTSRRAAHLRTPGRRNRLGESMTILRGLSQYCSPSGWHRAVPLVFRGTPLDQNQLSQTAIHCLPVALQQLRQTDPFKSPHDLHREVFFIFFA